MSKGKRGRSKLVNPGRGRKFTARKSSVRKHEGVRTARVNT